MADPYIGEIRMFAGNFAPRSYAFCDGQLLPISQFSALFSLLGTTYGGDGRSTFGLPDLRSRSPLHAGRGPGLTERRLGAAGGQAAVSLTPAQMPAHAHGLQGADAATTGTPSASVALAPTAGTAVYRSATTLVAGAAPLASTGGGQPHENRQPCLGVSFIIALQGVFPSRS